MIGWTTATLGQARQPRDHMTAAPATSCRGGDRRRSDGARLAGGGVKGGIVHGKSDEYGILPVEGAVHTHDLHATMLHLLGIDHKRLTFRFGGRDMRLTDVHGEVVQQLV